MKKSQLTSLVLIISLLITLLGGMGPTFAAGTGDWQYTVNADGVTCTINKYIGTEKKIMIPSVIDGYTVTELSVVSGSPQPLFKNRTQEEVIVPSTVVRIGDRAFMDSPVLTKVSIPSSVMSIGTNAFFGCTVLSEIALPSNLTSIGDNAFSMCLKLDHLMIPANVANIGQSAFSNCTSLTRVTLPEGLMSLGNSAFSSCSTLSSITIPSSITKIGEKTFNKCSLLQTISLSPNLTEIGKNAFDGCVQLTNFALPSKLTKIGFSAFNGCSQLTSITIPESVINIDYDAFKACTKLKDIYFDGNIDLTAKDVFTGGSPEAKYYAPAGTIVAGLTVTEAPTYAVTSGTIVGDLFTAGPVPNGTITTSTLKGMAGEVITIDVKADSGYALKSGSLTYSDGTTTLPIVNNQFVMLNKPVQVAGAFIKLEAPVVAPATVTDSRLKWNWTGKSGLSDSRYKLTTPDSTPLEWQYIATQALEVDALKAGNYNLEVQVKYNETSWSPSSIVSAAVERTKPTIVQCSPTGLNVSVLTNQVVLAFNETVVTNNGLVSITEGSQLYSFNVKNQSAFMSGTGSNCVMIIPMNRFVAADSTALALGRSKTYSVAVSSGAFVDACNNLIDENKVLGSFTVENPRCMITYNSNGGTGGVVPTDSKAYENGENAVILGGGTLLKEGHTFVGWNTSPDGSGVFINGVSLYKIGSQNLNLYAVWSQNPPSSSGDRWYTSSDSQSNKESSKPTTNTTPEPEATARPTANQTPPVAPTVPEIPVEKKVEPVIPISPNKPTVPPVEKRLESVKLKVAVNNTGKGTLKVALSDIKGLLEEALKNKKTQLALPLEYQKKAKGLELQLDPSLVKALNKGGIKTLTLKSDLVSYSFDQKTLAAMEKQAAKGIAVNFERSENKVGSKIKSTYRMTSSISGISVKMVQPYTLNKGEKVSDILLYVINPNKQTVRIKGITYDAKTKSIGFAISI